MKKKYLLKGDVSGIQEFIFNVSSKKAAKSLKARSFYVQLIGDLALKFLKNKIRNSVDFSYEEVYNGGGNFFLTIETNSNMKETVQTWQKIIDKELLRDEFYLSLSFTEYQYNNTDIDFGETWSAPLRLSQVAGDCIDDDNTVEGAVPAVGPNGEIYVSWAGPVGIVFDKSTDGGKTWVKEDWTSPTRSKNYEFRGLSVLDPKHCWITGEWGFVLRYKP